MILTLYTEEEAYSGYISRDDEVRTFTYHCSPSRVDAWPGHLAPSLTGAILSGFMVHFQATFRISHGKAEPYHE